MGTEDTNEHVCPSCGSRNLQRIQETQQYHCTDCLGQFSVENSASSLRIFLSYGRDEYAEYAGRIKADLEARGHEVWFDADRLVPGADFEIGIENGFEWAAAGSRGPCLVLLMTPHSVRRPDGYCLNEIARAVSSSWRILPVMLVWCEPPLSICRIQWLDLQDCVPIEENQTKYQQKLDQLVSALEGNTWAFDGRHSRLSNVLMPLAFTAEIAKHVGRFIGRKWVLDDLDQWLRDANASRVFWITGGPGVGKTALAAYICHVRPEAVAYLFCQFGHDDKADPRRCVMSLAYQLSSQIPEYQERLASMDLRTEIRKSAGTIFDNLIVQPLAALPRGRDRVMLIVIDALDEAKDRRDNNELAEFIASRFQDTPPWLRLVVTSRPVDEVALPLQALTPYRLATERSENIDDIRNFLQQRLQELPGHKNVPARLIDKILEKSQGTFLYVACVLEDLESGHLDLDEAENFPQGLGGIYQRFFNRQFPDRESFKENQLQLIEMVIAAREPLPCELLQGALRLDEYGIRAELDALGSLFPRSQNSVQPFHKTLIEWLTDAAKAGPYFVSLSKGHSRIADFCWEDVQTNSKKSSDYSISHLATHLVELERWEQLLHLVLSPELGLVNTWIQDGDAKGHAYLVRLTEYLGEHKVFALARASLSTQIARMYSLRGEYSQAEMWLKEALATTSRWRGRRIRAVALHETASLKLYTGDAPEAAKLYRGALRLCKWGLPVYRDEAAANLIGLASVERASMRFDKGFELARRALVQAKRCGDFRHEIAAKRLMGAFWNTLGSYDEAKTVLDEAIAACDQHGEHLEKGRTLLVLASTFYRSSLLQYELEPATKSCAESALLEGKRVQDIYVECEAELSLALYALSAKRTSEAEKWIQSLTAKLTSSSQHSELQMGLAFGQAAVLHQQGHLIRAKESYLQALTTRRGTPSSFSRLTVAIGAIYWHTGESAEAQRYWQRALAYSARISTAEQTLTLARIKLSKTSAEAVTP